MALSITDQQSLDNDSQFTGSPEEAYAAQIEGRLKDLHTYLPGIIQSFDSAKQTATVQIAIKRIFIEAGAVNLPLCVDVPVEFPGGGGFFLTFPVKTGDECTLAFSERAIDFWYQNGGVQLPAKYRKHDLSDAFARVGVNSQPNKIPTLSTTGTDLRTRDGSTFVRVEAGTITFKGNVVVLGNINQTGSQTVSGSIAAGGDVTAEGTSVHTHTHKSVQPGSGNSGVPN